MKNKVLIFTLGAALCLGMGSDNLAAGRPVTNFASAKSVPKAKGKPFRGHLKVVDLNAKVIVLQGAKAQTYQISSETQIKKDDKPATLKDINAGDPVTGYAREIAEGKWEARSVYAGKHTPNSKN